jgi:hypothetical protein
MWFCQCEVICEEEVEVGISATKFIDVRFCLLSAQTSENPRFLQVAADCSLIRARLRNLDHQHDQMGEHDHIEMSEDVRYVRSFSSLRFLLTLTGANLQKSG